MSNSKPQFLFSFTFKDGETITMITYDDARDALATELSQLNHIAELSNTLGLTLSVAFADFSNDLAGLTATAMKLAKAKVVGEKRQKNFAAEVEAYLQKYGETLPPSQRRSRLIDIIPTALKEQRYEDANDAFAAFVSGGPLLVLSDLVREMQTDAAELQLPLSDDVGDLQALKKDIDKLRASHATLDAVVKEIMRVQTQFAEDGKQRLAKADEKLAAFENMHADMQDKLALNESVSYWSGKKGKKIKHVKRLRLYSLALVAWVIVSLGLVGGVLAYCIRSAGDTPNLYELALYLPINILLVLMAVWGVRIFARLILSENHLATKAEEKGAMLQTYLALLNEGAALSDDRSVALEAIFATAQNAPIDDSMPAS